MDTFQTLLQAIANDDETQAQAAAEQIANLGVASFPRLKRLLASASPDERWWGAYALSHVQRPETPAHLLRALQDADSAVQQCAALGLSRHPSPQAVPALIAALPNADRLLARLTANALIAVGAQAVPPLLDVMENGPQAARQEAVRALAEIKDPRAISIFFTAIQDGDSSLVEYWSAIGLEKLEVGMMFFDPG